MRLSRTLGAILVFASVTYLVAAGHAQTIIYVDADATETPHDGSSWCHAYLTLYEALDWPPSPGTTIRVANGTYLPDPVGLGDPRKATFQLINGVSIEGGYAGCGAPDPDERSIDVHLTTLSGDIGTGGDDSDNSYHVVTGTNVDPTGVLDGFTISDGNANGAPDYNLGGGMFNDGASSNPTVRYCTFSSNSTGNGGHGGGMCNDWGASPTVANCTFTSNSAAENGGGMYNYRGSPIVTDCTFVGNDAGQGGGMLNHDGSNPTVIDCTFSENTAATNGGGMWNGKNSSPGVTNCTFSGNRADQYGSGMWNGENSSPGVTNCTFSGNRADQCGGGMFNNYQNNNPEVINSIFWANTDNDGANMDESAQIHDEPGSASVVSYTCIQACTAFCTNPDDHNIGDNPLFVTGPGGDFYLRQIASGQAADSPSVDAGSDTAVSLGLGLCGRTTRTDEVCDTGVVDMGYHYPVDCNDNGIPDDEDIANGTSEDCNNNCIPDECDNEPPVITCNGPVVLWEPDHDLEDVSSAITVEDPDGDDMTLWFRVFSDESEVPETGDGTGRHAPDFKDELFESGRGLLVRSERRGAEDGRFYILLVTADDGYGGVTTEVCIAAVVPHDQDQQSLDDVLGRANAAVSDVQSAVDNGDPLPPPSLYEHGLSGPLGPKQ